MLMHGAKEPLGVTSGLVLYLDAANARSYPKSGTTWFDRSGNGNNGTLVNGVGYNGSNYGSLSFDGVNDYVSTPNSASLIAVGNGSFTLTAFIKVNSSALGKNIWRRDNYLNQGAEGRRLIALGIGANTNTPSFTVYDGSNNSAIGSQNLADGLWHHVVGVYVSSTKTQFLYVDGVLRAQAVYNNTQSFNTDRQPWNMGTENNLSFTEPYNGNISQASIYNRALSAAEIKQNYDAFKGRYGLT
jgi:hypothetical protein